MIFGDQQRYTFRSNYVFAAELNSDFGFLFLFALALRLPGRPYTVTFRLFCLTIRTLEEFLELFLEIILEYFRIRCALVDYSLRL